jgi:hypothetical protein
MPDRSTLSKRNIRESRGDSRRNGLATLEGFLIPRPDSLVTVCIIKCGVF